MKSNPERFRAITYLIAAVVFLLVAALGTAGGETVFLVLAMVFTVLSLTAWRTSRVSS